MIFRLGQQWVSEQSNPIFAKLVLDSHLGPMQKARLVLADQVGLGKTLQLATIGKDGAPQAASLQQLEDGCGGRHGAACLALGEVFEDGNGVAKDEARALAYYRRGNNRITQSRYQEAILDLDVSYSTSIECRDYSRAAQAAASGYSRCARSVGLCSRSRSYPPRH